MIIYSTVYYLEVRNLGHFEDRILITAVFWFLLVFAVIEVIKNIKNLESDFKITKIFSNTNFIQELKSRKAIVFYSMLIYIIVIPFLGFFTTSFIVFATVVYLLGGRKIAMILIVDLGLCGGMYYLFVVLLRLRVPEGLFI